MSSKAERLKYSLRHYDNMTAKLTSLENINDELLSEVELYKLLKSINSELSIRIKQKKLISDSKQKRQFGKKIGELEQQKKAIIDYMKRNDI